MVTQRTIAGIENDDRPKKIKDFEDASIEFLPYLRENSKKLEDLHKSQRTRMSCLNKTFNEKCGFLVFYEDDPLDPEYINGLKMGTFIEQHFRSKKCGYITDIFLNPGITIRDEEIFVFVYNGKTKEWLS